MSRKVLISLVSDQTIPNVELIKEFQESVYKHIFIATKEKQNQVEWIKHATTIENLDLILVDAFDPSDIINKLNNYDFGDDEVMVNITGGTKLMALIASDFFKNLGAVIYYVTGCDKKYLKIFPNRGERIYEMRKKLSLKEYLTSYGFEYEETTTYKDFETAKKIFDFYTKTEHNKLIEIFESVRMWRGKEMKVKDQILSGFLEDIVYEFQGKLSKKDTKYLSGDWFEEYVYYKIKEETGLDNKEIATGINLIKEGIPNEIDVIFIKNHKLYIIECKTSVFDKRTIKRIRERKEVEEVKDCNILPEVIYKSDALRNKFGLFANTSIFTLDEIKDEKGIPAENVKPHFDRAELSRIRIVSKQDLISDLEIKNILRIED